MSRDIELEGEKVGRRQVKHYVNEIYLAKTVEDLGRIAGKAMLDLTLKEDFIVHNTFGRTEAWRRGFFEGFLERCDDLKSKR